MLLLAAARRGARASLLPRALSASASARASHAAEAHAADTPGRGAAEEAARRGGSSATARDDPAGSAHDASCGAAHAASPSPAELDARNFREAPSVAFWCALLRRRCVALAGAWLARGMPHVALRAL
jgi:hypothetical protein